MKLSVRVHSLKQHKATAFHEAGHAVARLYVGAEPTGAIIDGPKGFSFGTNLSWESAHSGQYAIWDRLICDLAGTHAEARASKRAIAWVALNSGLEDYRSATPRISQLVANGFANSESAAWRRAEEETREYIKDCWGAIGHVATALLAKGHLSADEVVLAASLVPRT